MKDRKKRWRQFRRRLDVKPGIKFNEKLSLNKNAGRSDFTRKEATLDLCVQNDNANIESQTKNANP
jgi:hypothetical protein